MRIGESELAVINQSLERGADVAIQITHDGGIRIVEQKIRVLSRKEKKPGQRLGLSDKRN